MHADNRVAPVEHVVGGDVEVVVGHPFGPRAEVGGNADLGVDADLGELRLQVFGHHLGGGGTGGVVHGHGKAGTVGLDRIPGLVEQLLGLFEVHVIHIYVLRIEGAERRDRGGGRRHKAHHDDLGEKIAVDGVGRCLTDPYVVERLLACVEGHPVEGADTGVALVGDHEVLVAGETLHFAEAVKERHGVHFAALDGHDAIVHIGNDLDDDAVDVRLALNEKVLVLLEHDVVAGLPFHKLERPAADGSLVRGILTDIGIGAVDVLGHDRAQHRGHAQQDGGMRLGEPDDRGVRIGRIHAGYGRVHGLEGMVGLDRHDGERHVLGGDRRAVMELGALDQMQGQAQAVGGHLPLFGEVGMRVPLVVVLERARKELRAGDARGDAGTQAGVQRNGVLRPGHRERAPVGDGFGLCGHRRKEHRRRQRGSGKELPTVRETCHRCTPYELALPWQRVGRTQGLRGWKRPCPNGASTLPSRATTLPRTTVQTGSPTPSSPSKAENGFRYRRE